MIRKIEILNKNYEKLAMDKIVYNNKTIDVLYVGRITEEKGLPSVIDTLKEHRNLQIHIIGDGPLKNDLIETSLGFEHINFHGGKSRNEVLDFISKSKFLLFPSIWYEGMPITIIEAFSSGVPVICRNLGAMADMIKDRVTGLKYYDNLSLSTTLNSLNKVDYDLMSKLALQEYKKYYSEDIALVNLKELING